MPRKPVGTNTRPTADWFAGSSASAGALAEGDAAGGVKVSLYNNADAGNYLWIWWFSVFNDAEAPYRSNTTEGVSGTPLGNAKAVTAGNPQPFGQTYWEKIPQIPFIINGTAFADDMYFGDEAGTDTCYRSPGPVAVLPPGFAHNVVNEMGGGPADGAILAVTWYFSVLPFIP